MTLAQPTPRRPAVAIFRAPPLIVRPEQERSFALTSHGLGDDERVRSPDCVARAVFGLHAARLSSPWTALRGRLSSFEPGELRNSLWREGTLIKLRCMRRTLHILPPELAQTAHSATLSQRLGACLATNRRLGLDHGRVVRRAARIEASLNGEAVPYRDLQRQGRQSRAEVILNRAAIKWLWESGHIAYVDQSRSLHHEQRAFALTGTAYPGLDLNVDPAQARVDLVEAHIRAFGPVSVGDMVWWSGMGRGQVVTAVNQLQADLVKVKVRGLADPTYLHASQVDGLRSSSLRDPNQVRLLGWEDPSLKGYFTTRSRYVCPRDYPRLFNSIGEARASIVVGGRVSGIWAWNRRERSIEAVHFLRPSRVQRQRIDALLADMAEFLRADVRGDQA